MEKITLKIAESNEIAGGEKVEVVVNSYADVSDGYHTIEELYDHRITLYVALCRKLQGFKYYGDQRNVMGGEKIVWRSKLHHDGTGYDGWYVLGIGRESGKQITYHIPISRWEETDFAETFDKAPCEFDGHTSADVLERLKSL